MTLIASSSIAGTATGGDVGAWLYVDGVWCASDRSWMPSGGTPHSSATCIQTLAPGTHTVQTVLEGMDGSSLNYAGYGRALF